MIFNKSDKQVRWIIGGSSGIGYELAKRYLQAGDKVCIFAHDQIDEAVATLNEFANESKKGAKHNENSDSVKGYEVDVTDTKQLAAVFNDAEQDFAAPDTVINSAGIAIAKSFKEMSEETPTLARTPTKLTLISINLKPFTLKGFRFFYA